MTEPIIAVKDLELQFNDRKLFDNLSFTIERGSFFSILGENGIGKTTLIKLITRQLKPTKGQIDYFPDWQALHFGYVPQFRNIDSEYPLDIKNFVSLNAGKWYRSWLTGKDKQAVQHALDQTQLQQIQHTRLGEASGGEKQKAYLAQALVRQPNVLILDEATASVDSHAKYTLMDLVKELNEKHGITVIFVTHDLILAKEYSQMYLQLEPNCQYQVHPISDLKLDAKGED